MSSNIILYFGLYQLLNTFLDFDNICRKKEKIEQTYDTQINKTEVDAKWETQLWIDFQRSNLKATTSQVGIISTYRNPC